MVVLLGGDGGVSGRHLDFLDFRLLESFGLGAPILEPDFDLGFGERERVGELGALGDGQVLFGVEFALERQQLLRREWRPRLPVGFVLPQMTRRRGDAQRRGRRVSVCEKEKDIV